MLSMTTPLIPQEIYVLEHYTSDNYVWELRETWAELIKLAEDALHIFMRNLPPDYRKRALPYQHDVVWEGTILPNFRSGLDGLNRCWIQLSRGNTLGLRAGGAVNSNISGFSRDYDSDLFDEPPVLARMPGARTRFDALLEKASAYGGNLGFTTQGAWIVGALGIRFKQENRGPIQFPSSWPIYRLNPQVRIKTDDEVKVSGIYLPDVSDSAPQYMIAGREGMDAYEANVGRDPETTHELSRVRTTWTLVERIADSGGGTPCDPDPIKAGVRLRAMAGEVCPRTGHWFTPARENSRTQFEAGQTMPDVGGTWGTTIWQWDEQQ